MGELPARWRSPAQNKYLSTGAPKRRENIPTGESALFSGEPAHGLLSDKRTSWPGDTLNFRDDSKHESVSPHVNSPPPPAPPPPWLTSRETPVSVLSQVKARVGSEAGAGSVHRCAQVHLCHSPHICSAPLTPQLKADVLNVRTTAFWGPELWLTRQSLSNNHVPPHLGLGTPTTAQPAPVEATSASAARGTGLHGAFSLVLFLSQVTLKSRAPFFNQGKKKKFFLENTEKYKEAAQKTFLIPLNLSVNILIYFHLGFFPPYFT